MMVIIFRLIIVIIFLPPMVGCTLKPIYSQKNFVKVCDLLSSIELGTAQNLYEAKLYNRLSDLLINVNPHKKYKLYLEKGKYNIEPTIIKKDADVKQISVKYNIDYKLVDMLTNKLLTSGSSSIEGSYQILDSAYDSYICEEQLRYDLADKTAGEIFKSLIIYFNK